MKESTKNVILIELARRWKIDAERSKLKSKDTEQSAYTKGVNNGRAETWEECIDDVLSVIELFGERDGPLPLIVRSNKKYLL